MEAVHRPILPVHDERVVLAGVGVLARARLMNGNGHTAVATFVPLFFMELTRAKLEPSSRVFLLSCLFTWIFNNEIVVRESQCCGLEVTSSFVFTLDILLLAIWHLPLGLIILFFVHFGSLFFLCRKLLEVGLLLLFAGQVGRH